MGAFVAIPLLLNGAPFIGAVVVGAMLGVPGGLYFARKMREYYGEEQDFQSQPISENTSEPTKPTGMNARRGGITDVQSSLREGATWALITGACATGLVTLIADDELLRTGAAVVAVGLWYLVARRFGMFRG